MKRTTLGPKARARLEVQVHQAVNRWPGRYESGRARSCKLCGHINPSKADDLCRTCRKAPDDNFTTFEILAEWSDLDFLLGRRATVDEIVRRMDLMGWDG
jgi:RecJ-like exonuclease